MVLHESKGGCNKENTFVLFERTNYNGVRRADMDYMKLKEASEKWGVTPRWINYYCSAGLSVP